ncbi:helix-hairpin-helix domain-containing protein [Candidatus Omnitrophota bacterium]
MDIKKKVKNFPDSPGVYLMKDTDGEILYVGKACSLRKRVGSYFQKPPTAKTQELIRRSRDIEYLATSSSAQALLLENILIKRHQPFYNAALKDDKSYPYVKISADEYPGISIVRGEKVKGARYFGPYTSVKLLKTALKAIRPLFPFRSCRRLPKKPCLYFQLKLCPGICAGKVEPGAYRDTLRQLELFLEGRHNELLRHLQDQMRQAAGLKQFEQAAKLRDRINSLVEIISQTKQPSGADLIVELQKTLGLSEPPYRIEAFDISEISGAGLSGSMVSFLSGWPDKNNYRKFKIRTVKGIDDYAMIAELLRRRYAPEKRKVNSPLPDLVIIDGGKGHLNLAQKTLKTLGLTELPVIALAKRLETIYACGGKVINLPGDSKLLHLLQRIRDEAHRFAISYHHKLREKSLRQSALDGIGGVGEKRKKLLLRHFKTVSALKQASRAQLLKVKGIDLRTAENISKHFK